ncbi:Uncharacterised protein [uncultured archaeon]|nr:Uncharacterised protein [uncultured archaeon]
MQRIKSLYDALIKYHNKENQCTNFLVWILGKLPPTTMLDICKLSDLSIDNVEFVSNNVQPTFEKSTPDAIIEFSNEKYLIIETKRFDKSFVKEQFINHFDGGRKKFGEENTWILFLSGDGILPDELKGLKKEYFGKIGFLSWKSILQLLEEKKKSLEDKYEIILEEFITFAKHYGLGRLKHMNNEEIIKFIDGYPFIAINRENAQERFSKLLNEMQRYIIAESEEAVEENKNEDDYKKGNNEKLPCPYRCLKIEGWHTEKSAYVFINILSKEIGIVLTGYQSEGKEKKIFWERWNEYMKNDYKDNPNLESFTFVDTNSDDDIAIAINSHYFKHIPGFNGNQFSPDMFPEFKDYFFWGCTYTLDIGNIEKSFYEKLAKDFKKLIDTFRKNNDHKSRKKSTKKLH